MGELGDRAGVVGGELRQLLLEARAEDVAIVYLAEDVLQGASLVLDDPRGGAEHLAEHLERVAQPLGGDAQVVQFAHVGRVAHGRVQREQVEDALPGDPLRGAAELRSRPQPLDAARLHVAETSASAVRSSSSASAAIAG